MVEKSSERETGRLNGRASVNPVWLMLAAALTLGCTAELGAESGSAAESGTGGSAAPGEQQPEPQLYLLTHVELGNTLATLIGGPPLLASEVQPDRSMAGFASAGAGEHSLSSLGVDRWETAINTRLNSLFQDAVARTALVGCVPATVEDPCVETFLREFGLLAWRRPLSRDEVDRYRAVATDTSAEFDGDPWEGVRYATQALLQSPHLLYRVYLGDPDVPGPGPKALTAHELATKLSFALTQSPPDAPLLDAANAGTLSDPREWDAQVGRLLASSAAELTLTRFCRELFSLSTLHSAVRTEEVIDTLSETLLAEMEQESIRFCVDGLTGADARTTLLASHTTLGPELAALYGVFPETGTIALPGDSRAGVLTSAGFLTVMAHQDRTSPTLRGRFVRERLLCQEIPDPPPEAVTELPEPSDSEGATMRDRLSQHSEDPGFATCHSLTDPIGFALEHFDAVGRFRETENGLTIDATGMLDGVPFDGARELSVAISDHPSLPRCLATQWFRFSQARLETSGDEALLSALGDGLIATDFHFKNLMIELTHAEAFRTILTEPAP